MKSNQTVLLASMAVCLGASLLTLAYSSRKVSGWSEAAEEHRLQALRTSLRCDTLAAVNSFLAAEAESALVLRRQNDSLRLRLEEARLASEFPGYYLVIDTFQNRFHLRRGGMLVRSGFVGTGKGWTESANGQTWDFSTPRGLRQVLYKTRNPYWFRPDWYWQEQSLTPPPPGQEVVIPQDLSWEEQVAFFNDSLTASQRVWVRVVPGALGSYALDLGGGILLHYGVGRGNNVSHGCIRLGHDDLEAVFRTLEVGSPVIIY